MTAYAPRRHRQLRPQRSTVSVPASIVTLSAYQFPELADISQTGAKLRGAPLPPKGATALLRVEGLEVMCRVVWVKDGHCGIRFDEHVPPAALKQIHLAGATLEPVRELVQEVHSGAEI